MRTGDMLMLRVGSIVLLTLLSAFPADSSNSQLTPEGSPVAVDGLADQTHGFLKWSHGAFLYTSLVNGMPPSFYTLGRDGGATSSATLELPHGGPVWSADFDRGEDGTIISAGGFWAELDPFIAWIDGNGKTSHVIHTAPYYAYAVAVAPDNTVWTAGVEMIGHEITGHGLDPDAPVLRHFDAAGKLIGSAIPESQILKKLRVDGSKLGVAGTHLGWYVPGWRERSKYFEIDLGSMEMHTYPGAPTREPAVIDGFSLTDSGNVAVSIEERKGGRKAYVLARSALRWNPLEVPTLGGYSFTPQMLGSDGEQLVFEYANSAAFFSLKP